MPLPKFRLSLLARFEMSGPDGPVDLPNKKLAGLLAYLACTAPVPQSREKLATLLWGSHFETQAQQNLRQALFRLRRALGHDALISDGEEVWLAPGVIDCDAVRLEALIAEGSSTSLAAAADLYQDPLLADVTIAEEAWADWLGAERPRLEGLALGAMIGHAERELQAGNAESALKAANRAIAVNALREDAHRLIVQALAAAGRKPEALKHYQDLVALLKRELNTEPDAVTKSLVADLGSTPPPSRSPALSEDAKPALPQPDRLSLSDKPSIAVLAFQNMSGDPEQEYFSDGISEDIITGLSKISGLMVIARNSSFTYKGKAVDIRAIGSDLGVRCVLEGSVRRAGNRVRITAQLIDASDGVHLWAERFDRELSDLFAVQDDVTSKIVNALKVTLSPAEKTRLGAGGTGNVEAYDHLLRGREFLLGAAKTRETFERATKFFAMALELDPNYSQAYAGLGWAYVFDYQNRWSDDPDSSLQLAKQNVARAIENDANEPLAHVTASIVATYERDLDRSKTEADLALILNPNCTEAYACLGQVCTFSGRPLEAIPMLEHAMRLDPAYIQQYLHLLGVANVLADRFETAAAVLRQRILLVPETDFSRAVLASALGHLGEIDEAHRVWLELKEINPRYTFSEHFGRQPFKNKDDVRRIAEGLAKAGLSSVADLGSTWPSMEHEAEAPAERDDVALSAMAVRSASPERRQLTIMVCNIVGSMQLSAQLDPEDMLDLVAAFHKAVAAAVSQFDGYVARYLGDGVHVYFGYPKADEHDAEQAVRAGLAIASGVGTLKAAAGVILQASVGIATGLVVVAGRPGTAEALQRVAIGEAPNVAAQLQELASPGEVVIATSTQRLVGRMFDCRALAVNEAKGLEAWQVRGETAGVTRFHARRAGALSPLVGRQEESELLLRRWNQAKLREGRVVLISGESGIGKSRIAENLLARLAGESEPHVRLRYFCSPHHRHSPLYPFIAQLEQAASFPPGSDVEARLDRLDAMLRPTAKNLPREAALIAELLGVPADGRYPALTVTPQQKREMTLATILDQLEGVAAQRPVVIVVEDVHWIDPTSLDLLSRTVARIANLPVLLVLTFRPEFQPTWVGEANVSLLPLSRLGRRDSTALIGGITQDKALPGAVVEQVLSRTDGVPLFIEELTSMLLESGVLRETADGYALDGPLPELAIPTTLQASLVARLDRLVMIEDVAQIGATIGREFSYELVAAVSALAPRHLDVALERLTTSGLISRRGMPPDASYSFKHALVRDAAYATLLKSRRRQLHASIGKALVEQFPATVESLPEVAAHHFTEAALAREAIDHWVKAGRLMHARSANREAVTCFEQALDLLKELPETGETLELAVDVRLDLKNSLHPLGAVDPIIDHLRDAERPARTLGDQRRLGQLFVHMCHALEIAGRPIEAIAYGQKALALVESLGDLPLQVLGNLYLGAACHGTGDYQRAQDILLRVLRLLENEPGRDRIDVPGFPAVQAHGYLTRLFIAQGRFEQASVHGHEGIRLAEALNHPYSMSAACWILAWLEISRGELRHAVGLLERGLAPALEWNLNYVSAADTGALGYAYALLGRTAEGLPMLERALATFENMKHRSGELQFLLLLGEACVLTDRLADALKFARRALTDACERGLRNHEARALWLLGEATSHSDPPEHADRHYRDALALAEPRGMRPLVAHCHLGLGKLYRRTGKRELAQEHVATATTMYREMNMPFWLEQVEADAETP